MKTNFDCIEDSSIIPVSLIKLSFLPNNLVGEINYSEGFSGLEGNI